MNGLPLVSLGAEVKNPDPVAPGKLIEAFLDTMLNIRISQIPMNRMNFELALRHNHIFHETIKKLQVQLMQNVRDKEIVQARVKRMEKDFLAEMKRVERLKETVETLREENGAGKVKVDTLEGSVATLEKEKKVAIMEKNKALSRVIRTETHWKKYLAKRLEANSRKTKRLRKVLKERNKKILKLTEQVTEANEIRKPVIIPSANSEGSSRISRIEEFEAKVLANSAISNFLKSTKSEGLLADFCRPYLAIPADEPQGVPSPRDLRTLFDKFISKTAEPRLKYDAMAVCAFSNLRGMIVEEQKKQIELGWIRILKQVVVKRKRAASEEKEEDTGDGDETQVEVPEVVARKRVKRVEPKRKRSKKMVPSFGDCEQMSREFLSKLQRNN